MHSKEEKTLRSSPNNQQQVITGEEQFSDQGYSEEALLDLEDEEPFLNSDAEKQLLSMINLEGCGEITASFFSSLSTFDPCEAYR